MAAHRKPVGAKCLLNIGAYLTRTMDFSAQHHGMYVLLAGAAMMNKGILPNDERFLAQTAKCTISEWQKQHDRIVRFFDITPESWTLNVDHFARVRVIFEDDGRLPQAAWASLRAKIFERDAFTCTYCGAIDLPLECDHVVPVSKGGGNDEDNLTTACKPCNRSKRDKMIEEWMGTV
jgi:hypothetical protein